MPLCLHFLSEGIKEWLIVLPEDRAQEAESVLAALIPSAPYSPALARGVPSLFSQTFLVFCLRTFACTVF